MDPSTLSDREFRILVGLAQRFLIPLSFSISTADKARGWLLEKYLLSDPSALDTRVVKFMGESLDQVPLYMSDESRTISTLAMWRLEIAR